MSQKKFTFQWVVKFPGRLILVGILSFSLLPEYGCKAGARLKEGVKTENREAKVDSDKTAILVPFYKTGSLAFTGKNARREKEAREEKEKKESAESKEKQKEEFEKQAQERFKGMEDLYWISPPQKSELFLALKGFPKDGYGYPDWAAASKTGLIKPRDSIKEIDEEEQVFNSDIIFKINDKMMANVRFPHRIHNYWLSCKICHPGIFIAKKGANDFAMTDIWAGKFCGRCHGKIAFPPKGFKNCQRCHSVKREKVFFGFYNPTDFLSVASLDF